MKQVNIGLVLLLLVLVMLITRSGVSSRFTELDTQRVEDQMRLTRLDLAAKGSDLENMLASLGTNITADKSTYNTAGGKTSSKGR